MSTGAVIGRGSRHPDVRRLQNLLNQQPALGIRLQADGVFGAWTEAAVRRFQASRGLVVDGVVGPQTWQALTGGGASAAGPGVPRSDDYEPSWLQVARREMSAGPGGGPVRELPGYESNNPRILKYLSTAPHLRSIPVRAASEYMMSEVDETPWCGCFVNWCLKQAGYSLYRRGATARAWLQYGERLEQPCRGAITVIYRRPRASIRSTTTSGYHVGFYISGHPISVRLLGGNQRNRVCESTFSGWAVQGYRWPR